MAANLAERNSPPAKSPHHQHAPGLAPLEYLQLTQRRGSITDPSLFQASAHHPTSADHSPPRQHPLAASFTAHRQSSYSFPATNNNKMPESSSEQSSAPRAWPAQQPPDHTMDTEPTHPPTSGRGSTGPDSGRPNAGSFLPPPPFTGSKRKMSHDRQGYNYPEDSNTGAFPAYPPNQDMDAPNPKRRGSTFDPNNRIAHLTLQDRRDSVDSRSSLSGLSMGGGWGGDRRDSAASVYSTTSVGSNLGGYSTAGQGEHSSKPYWSPTAQHQAAQEGTQRPFAFPQDPVPGGPQPPSSQQSFAMPPGAPVPSVHYSASAAVARRLSIPESSLPINGIKPRSRAARGSRAAVTSNSDDSARSSSEAAPTATSPLNQPGGDGATMSPNYVGNLQPPSSNSRKETPYSRSPELRVSHKMAERKRRKEMKELFDELRDQLPQDRGMKASKWEILSKAVDYISQLKVAYTNMSQEIDGLRGEVDTLRPGGGSQVPHSNHAFILSGGAAGAAVAPSPGAGPAPTETSSLAREPMQPPQHHNGNGQAQRSGSYERPGSANSSNQGSIVDLGRSPSMPLRPLQAQHTGSQAAHSPYNSHHQTPTPQQPPQPLPQQDSK